MIRNAVKTESVYLSFIHEKWPASENKRLGKKDHAFCSFHMKKKWPEICVRYGECRQT